jgi:hypothetical protein
MKTNPLFIGGPLNGRKDIQAQYDVYSIYENNLYTNFYNGMMVDNYKCETEPVFVKEHRYFKYRFGSKILYIHEKLTFEDAITKLISCYRGGKRKKKY